MFHRSPIRIIVAFLTVLSVEGCKEGEEAAATVPDCSLDAACQTVPVSSQQPGTSTGSSTDPGTVADPEGSTSTASSSNTGTSTSTSNSSVTVTSTSPTDDGGPARWRAANVIQLGSGYTQYLDLASAPGHGVAVWVQLDGVYSVWAARYSSTLGWSPAEKVSATGANCQTPAAAINSHGDIVLVWRQEATTDDLFVATYTASGGWTAAALFADNSRPNGAPRVAMNDNRAAVVAWYTADAVRYSIWSRTYTVAGGWGASQMIEANGAYHSYDPDLAMDSNGDTLVVWQKETADGGTGHADIWSNRYTTAGGWGTAAKLESQETYNAYNPVVRMDPSGNALAIWSQGIDASNRRIWAARYTSGTGWAAAAMIENAGSYSDGLDLAVNQNGDAVAAWRGWDQTNYYLKVTPFDASTGWGTTAVVPGSTMAASNMGLPRVAYLDSARSVLNWTLYDGIRVNVNDIGYAVTGGFSTASLREVSAGGNSDFNKLKAIGPDEMLSVWQKSDGISTLQIWGAIYR